MFKIALIQMNVVKDTKKNIKHARKLCIKAANNNADIIVLPEIFTCEYNAKTFPVYAFDKKSEYYKSIQDIAMSTRKYLVAGSIPELSDDGKIYNTSFVFDPDGIELCYHRKAHLFDIDVVGGQHFKESETLSSGSTVTVFDTPFARIGLMICYDIRFPEFSRKLVDKGAELIIVPAAFNMTTGPCHWELSFRARALDNQVYMAGCSSARNEFSNYISYANSIVTSPWGDVVKRAGETEEIIYADIDTDYVHSIRGQLPLLKHRRGDLY